MDMRKSFTIRVSHLLTALLIIASTSFLFAQDRTTKVGGKVTDATTKDGRVGVSIQVKGKVIGTITDTQGNFELTTTTNPPFTLVVSSVGYESQEVAVSGNQTNIAVILAERAILGQEVII